MKIMDCETAGSLLHAYFDDELDLASSLEMERHLEGCAACTARLARERSLRARFAATHLGVSASPQLREKIVTALDLTPPSRMAPASLWTQRVLSVAVLAAGVMLLVSLVLVARNPSAELLLAQQIRDGHVRSLMAAHLADVSSSDRHTVKPWFAGKLGFAPTVEDLSDEGFPLVGGRLDYLDHRPMAAIVYKRREHVINLFIWPAEDTAPVSPRLLRENGYQIVHWASAGMTCWAISDLNSGELEEFAKLVESRATRPARGAASDPAPDRK